MGARPKSAAIAVFIFAACESAGASPWNRADNEAFAASRFDYFWATTPVSRFERYGSDTYIEYGLTQRLMLSGKVYYGTSVSDSGLGQFSRTRFGDSELAIQRQIRRGEHSATAVSIAGAWTERLANGERTPFVDSNVDLEIRALHGRDIVVAPIKIFATAEVAYRRRFGAAADQARADFLVGIEPSPRILLLTEARAQFSLGNNGVGGDDFNILKSRASLVWRATDRWAIVAGAEKELFARDITPGTGVFLGLWSQF